MTHGTRVAGHGDGRLVLRKVVCAVSTRERDGAPSDYCEDGQSGDHGSHRDQNDGRPR